MKTYKEFQKITRTDYRGENWPQWIGLFPNGYGVSIVEHAHSYGRELALLAWEMDESGAIKWELVYDKGNFIDVIGWLTDREINAYCREIQNKPSRFV